MRRIVVAIALLLPTACGGGPGARVVVAAGTTVVDSGVLDDLAAAFEAVHPGIEISIVGDATARVLELGRRGAAEVLISHNPEAEAVFVAEVGASRYEALMTSRFVLVGPREAMAAVAGMGPADAFLAVSAAGTGFVGRGDGSGTALAEERIWRAAAVDPIGRDGYLQTGLGMGETLQVADQRGAVTLAERGAFLEAADRLTLVAADLAPDPLLRNPYHVILVAGASPAAVEFVEWLLSPAGREVLRQVQMTRFGEVVYVPG